MSSIKNASSPWEPEKQQDLEKINECHDAYEKEMVRYVEKYVLKDRSWNEVFAVAHQCLISNASEEYSISGLHVLEEIVSEEFEYADKKQVREIHNLMVKCGLASELKTDEAQL
jgi:hypothetical protein